MNRIVQGALSRALAVVLLGCPASSMAAEVGIRGAGATFPQPIYAQWILEYKQATGVEIAYAPVGSGEGVNQIERRQVDFGATDVPLAAADLQRIGLVQFPAVIGGVVPVVNISGIGSGDLKLTGHILADIYLGKVRKWNDRGIVELNPGLKLPNENITVVHRSDASGTTYLWSEFLSRSNLDWKSKVGAAKLLNWPVGVAEVGNEGVASSVQRTKVSIGYVEYAYAKQHRLSVVSLRNREGAYTTPSKATFEAAAAAAQWRAVADLDQLLIDQRGPTSWPIVGASFILLPNKLQTPARTREVMKFFSWALRQGGQSATDLDYVALPASAVELIEKNWAEQVRSAAGEAVWQTSSAPRQ